MADCCSRSVVAIVIILLCIGLGGIISGGVGTSWYTESSALETKIGMWKSCQSNDVCQRRKDLLRFKDYAYFYKEIENKCK
jgi:hypothetical protein